MFAATTKSLISFDVFETLLVRSLSPHHAVFDRVGEFALRRGLIRGSAHAFAQARMWAETRAYENVGDRITVASPGGKEAVVAILGRDGSSAKDVW